MIVSEKKEKGIEFGMDLVFFCLYVYIDMSLICFYCIW